MVSVTLAEYPSLVACDIGAAMQYASHSKTLRA